MWFDEPQGIGDARNVDPEMVGLTDRLVDALTDWAAFFDEVGGDLADAEVAEEFVGQGYKIAHKLRGELKGSTVHLMHPVTGERIEIVRRTVR